MIVKKVGIDAIPSIQQIAYSAWAVAYKDILLQPQIDYMLAEFYCNSSLQKQIEEQAHQFILLSDNNITIGFASYSLKSELEKSYQLNKIYINPANQGKGSGKILIAYIINQIKNFSSKSLQLNVNRHNEKAISFYKKFGFNIIAEQNISIGNNYFMDDFVMALSL